MTNNPARANSVDLTGIITAADIRGLGSHPHIEHLSMTKMPRLTARVAKGFSSLQSVDQLWLWCDVTRTAMRHAIAIPGLRMLDVLAIVKPGKLEGFSAASTLEVLRANHYLTAEDVLEICTCKSIRELGVQGAELSAQVIRALLDMPNLVSLDIESSDFNDAMAKQISESDSITSLEVGATRITREGLGHLCKMRQLRSLDLWANKIDEADLDMLQSLPNLEYVSVGGQGDKPAFHAATLLPRLEKISSLKHIWLDGVAVDASQRLALEARYETARITFD